jgi:nitrate reductase delta subunit
MMTITPVYEALAELLEYPRLRLDIESCSELICNEPSNVTNSLAEFRASVAGLSLNELQELYTRTFDLSPVCALDIGYHLFGENYKRGVFLANLRETEAPFDLGQERQLPDYLPVLLRLLTKLDDEGLRSALIVDCMIPALEKMLKTLSEGDNPYRHLIDAVNTKLSSEAGAYPATIQRAHLPVLQAASFSAETNTDLF